MFLQNKKYAAETKVHALVHKTVSVNIDFMPVTDQSSIQHLTYICFIGGNLQKQRLYIW